MYNIIYCSMDCFLPSKLMCMTRRRVSDTNSSPLNLQENLEVWSYNTATRCWIDASLIILNRLNISKQFHLSADKVCVFSYLKPGYVPEHRCTAGEFFMKLNHDNNNSITTAAITLPVCQKHHRLWVKSQTNRFSSDRLALTHPEQTACSCIYLFILVSSATPVGPVISSVSVCSHSGD